jgi:hypothetical protein
MQGLGAQYAHYSCSYPRRALLQHVGSLPVILVRIIVICVVLALVMVLAILDVVVLTIVLVVLAIVLVVLAILLLVVLAILALIMTLAASSVFGAFSLPRELFPRLLYARISIIFARAHT